MNEKQMEAIDELFRRMKERAPTKEQLLAEGWLFFHWYGVKAIFKPKSPVNIYGHEPIDGMQLRSNVVFCSTSEVDQYLRDGYEFHMYGVSQISGAMPPNYDGWPELIPPTRHMTPEEIQEYKKDPDMVYRLGAFK